MQQKRDGYEQGKPEVTRVQLYGGPGVGEGVYLQLRSFKAGLLSPFCVPRV